MSRTVNTYTENDRSRVLLALKINDGNVKRTARETGVPEQTVRNWKQAWERDGVPEAVEQLAIDAATSFAERAERVRDLALDKWEDLVKANKVNAKDLMIGVGILTDKIDRARGLSRGTPEQAQQGQLPSREELAALAQGIVRGALDAVHRRDQEIEDAEVVEQATEALPPAPDN